MAVLNSEGKPMSQDEIDQINQDQIAALSKPDPEPKNNVVSNDRPSFLNDVGNWADKRLDQNLGQLDIAATMAIDGLTSVAGGYYAGWSEILSGGKADGNEKLDTFKQYNRPLQTDEGLRQAKVASDVLSYIPDAAQIGADAVYDATDSPLAGTAARVTIEALPEIFGLGFISRMKKGTRLWDEEIGSNGEYYKVPTADLREKLSKEGLVWQNLTPSAQDAIPQISNKSTITGQPLVPEVIDSVIKEQIKSGARTDALAGLKLQGNRVIKDRVAVKAIDQGFTNGFIQNIKNFTPETKKGAIQQFRRSQAYQADNSVRTRHGDVVGEATTNRVKVIRDSNLKMGVMLNDIVNNGLNNVKVDFNNVTEPFETSLLDSRIGRLEPRKGKAIGDLDFSESVFSENPAAQRAIKSVDNLIIKAERLGSVKASDAHLLKRQLDDLIDIKKIENGGLSAEPQKIMLDVRRAVNESVREISPKYARVNDLLSLGFGALQEIQDGMGKKMNLYGRGADSAIGTKLKALTSNLASRVPLENAIYGLDDTAKFLQSQTFNEVGFYEPFKLGGSSKKNTINLNDNIRDLVDVSNAIDAKFTRQDVTSFSPQIQQAIDKSIDRVVVRQFGPSAALGAAVDTLKATMNKNKNSKFMSDTAAYESIIDLLKQ